MMRLSIYLLLLLLFTKGPIWTQGAYELEWTRSEASGIDPYPIDCISPFDTECQKVRLDHDDNVIVAGSSLENETADLLVVKYANNGDLLWKRLIDVLPESADYLVDIFIDEENNIFLLSHSQIPEIGTRTILLKLNSQGETLWTNRLLEDYEQSLVEDIVRAPDGSFYITGFTRYFTLLSQFNGKVNEDGFVEWLDVDDFIPGQFTSGVKVHLVGDNIVFLGKGSPEDITIYSPAGELLEIYTKPSAATGFIIRNDQSGNFIMSTTEVTGIIKFDSYGNEGWQFELPDHLPENTTSSKIRDIVIDEDGAIYATGEFRQEETLDDLFVIKLSATGELLYEYYHQRQTQDIGTRLYVGQNNYSAVGGYSFAPDSLSLDYLAVILDPAGNALDTIDFEEVGEDVVKSVILDNDLNLYLTGTQNGNTLTQKYGFDGTVGVSTAQDKPEIVIAPNPADQKITIQATAATGPYALNFFDLTGRCVLRQSGVFRIEQEVDISMLARGIYFLQLNVGKSQITKKLIKN